MPPFFYRSAVVVAEKCGWLNFVNRDIVNGFLSAAQHSEGRTIAQPARWNTHLRPVLASAAAIVLVVGAVYQGNRVYEGIRDAGDAERDARRTAEAKRQNAEAGHGTEVRRASEARRASETRSAEVARPVAEARRASEARRAEAGPEARSEVRLAEAVRIFPGADLNDAATIILDNQSGGSVILETEDGSKILVLAEKTTIFMPLGTHKLQFHTAGCGSAKTSQVTLEPKTAIQYWIRCR
jgi:hypothetical protein